MAKTLFSYPNLVNNKNIAGPLVYAYCIDENVLYVGYSSVNSRRAFLNSHDKAKLRKFPDVIVRIIPCSSVDEAKALENEIICRYNPPGNKHLNSKHIPNPSEPKLFGDTKYHGKGPRAFKSKR